MQRAFNKVRGCCKIDFLENRSNNLAVEIAIVSRFLPLFLTFRKVYFHKFLFCNSPLIFRSFAKR